MTRTPLRLMTAIATAGLLIGATLPAASAATQAPTAAPGPTSPGEWWRQGPADLVVTYKVAPGARLSFREAIRASLLPRLARLHAAGDLTSYHVLINRYVDSKTWDVMALLDFSSPAALWRWRSVEQAAPAGLSPAGLALTSMIETAPGSVLRSNAAPHRAGDPAPAYLVVPYDYLVSTDEYLRYADGYVIPQVDGWIAAGALSGYQLFLPRYAAGREWSALLVLAYRGDAGLARRDEVTRQVRERLSASPAWKAYADSKVNLRVEKQPIVADEMLPNDR